MKKKLFSLLLVLCMMLSVLPFGASAVNFTDVNDGAYYAEPVYWAVNSDPQITNGVDPTHFAPDRTCTRDQVVTFLWRALGKQKAEGTSPFVDVNKDAYYYDAVRWAVERNITNGTDATHFSPGKACTRGEVATFLWRAMQKPTASLANPFKDVKKGEFYEQAVLWAYEAGVTNGTSATAFSPNNTCTRGQIVTFLYRTFNPEYAYLTVKETITNPDGSQFGYTWKYDDRGNNIRSATLDGSVWEEYTYDDAGNRISCTNSRGETYKIDNSGSGDEGPWKVDQ